MTQYGHTVYQTKQNLPGKDYIYFSSRSDQLSGRYTPETGRDCKKTDKNGQFLEVFAKFDTLPNGVFI